MSEQVIKLIDELAKRLTIPFDKALEIAEKQIRYYFVTDVIWIILSVIALVFVYKFVIMAFKQIKEENGFIYSWQDNSEESFSFVCVIAIPIIIIWNIICIMVSGFDMLQIIVNPDFSVIKVITKLVK